MLFDVALVYDDVDPHAVALLSQQLLQLGRLHSVHTVEHDCRGGAGVQKSPTGREQVRTMSEQLRLTLIYWLVWLSSDYERCPQNLRLCDAAQVKRSVISRHRKYMA